MVSHRAVARDTAETGLIRLFRALAVILPSLALVQALADARDYRQPAVAVAVWLAVLCAGTWLVPRLGTGSLAAGETAAAGAGGGAGVGGGGGGGPGARPGGGPRPAVLGTIWLVVLVAMTHRARVWVPAALLVFAVHSALLIRDGGLNQLTLSQLEAAGYISAAVLLAFAALRPTMDMSISMAARQASLASRSQAERAAAAAIQQERQSRLAVLEREALPLLDGIASGALDPTSAGVRERCARHAAVLRLSLTDGARGAGQLMAALDQALRAAAADELPVAVQVIGDPGTPQPLVARAALATVSAVISVVPPCQAMLTVLAPGDDVELFLTFSAPLRRVPDLTPYGRDVPAAARWRAAVSTTETGGGYLEVSWRKDGAA